MRLMADAAPAVNHRFMNILIFIQLHFGVCMTGEAELPLALKEQRPIGRSVTAMAGGALAFGKRFVRILDVLLFFVALAASLRNSCG